MLLVFVSKGKCLANQTRFAKSTFNKKGIATPFVQLYLNQLFTKTEEI
ncbi:hypothetical protein VCRA2126O84_150057 [Vibrio crassostreae]|nr:hypothetical protein VCRA2126O84_150057 [Vibrio crassostreae]CAK3127783.1 hypothetical protein VCRA2128O101_140045 [Vibrio crassostreae]CAK3232701.1 hypothetical protein VCRA2128O107_150057 [Vibrio crassostreae]CAK3280599.1 hypothetical protein VCRA2128O109_140075 [Vibrio crassostreae]CAK3755037.1 hypothetical protein VCRA2128O93_140075 [Vibrio crassostreae]